MLYGLFELHRQFIYVVESDLKETLNAWTAFFTIVEDHAATDRASSMGFDLIKGAQTNKKILNWNVVAEACVLDKMSTHNEKKTHNKKRIGRK